MPKKKAKKGPAKSTRTSNERRKVMKRTTKKAKKAVKKPARKKTARKPVQQKAIKKTPARKKSAPKKKLVAKKPVPKKAAVNARIADRSIAGAGKKIAGAGKKKPAPARSRALIEPEAAEPEPFTLDRVRARPGGQSGDLQGLSNIEEADSESVDELLEEGNAFEADVVRGVEDAGDHGETEVHTHEVPEDDVPSEYLEEDE
jgi:hypothetical protein